MFYPYGFGLGSHWLLYIGVPLILGIWAQIRVTSAFRKWGEVRASSNITGAECAQEILRAAQIPDVEVCRDEQFPWDIMIQGQETAPVEQCLSHSISSGARHRRA